MPPARCWRQAGPPPPAPGPARPAGVRDLSEEPVLNERRRLWLASTALAAGLVYAGSDFELRPPATERLGGPSLALTGTGKRGGKTALAGHTARLLREAGRDPVIVAMGRGGPPEPELVGGDGRQIG